ALAFAAALILTALLATPTAHGDSGEYFLMVESLFNHLTPDARPEDLNSLADMGRRDAIRGGYGHVMAPYLMTAAGRWYAIHFWAYPLACLPAKLLLRLACLNEIKAPQLTNAVLFAALLLVVLRSGLKPGPRRIDAVLLALSPALGFVLWPHPEVYSFALVGMALAFMHDDRRVPALVCASLASLQNPPLVLFVAYLWLRWAVRARGQWNGGPAVTLSARWPELAVLTAAAAIAALPAAFYLAHFGTPSPLARDAAGPQFLSPRKAADLFVDLNIGMLPYAPIAVVGALAFGAFVIGRSRARAAPLALAAVVALMAVACTATTNWNHGTTGPSRYAVWLLPFVFYAFADAGESPALPRRAWPIAAVLAVAAQATIVALRGAMFSPEDYGQHSYAARLVLDRWPALYSPTPEIFMNRTPRLGGEHGPYVYTREGACRKAFARPKHAALLREACGPLPERAAAFFTDPDPDDKRWAYVNY
ncbi:MAG TPA: hypothetical protein VGQ78_02185, partial [Vicinamibacteria bacterium]|nr:hypothetical protein [Vicinamibacteria bacterium]